MIDSIPMTRYRQPHGFQWLLIVFRTRSLWATVANRFGRRRITFRGPLSEGCSAPRGGNVGDDGQTFIRVWSSWPLRSRTYNTLVPGILNKISPCKPNRTRWSSYYRVFECISLKKKKKKNKPLFKRTEFTDQQCLTIFIYFLIL